MAWRFWPRPHHLQLPRDARSVQQAPRSSRSREHGRAREPAPRASGPVHALHDRPAPPPSRGATCADHNIRPLSSWKRHAKANASSASSCSPHRRGRDAEPQAHMAVGLGAAPDHLVVPRRHQLVDERCGIRRVETRGRVGVERERDEPERVPTDLLEAALDGVAEKLPGRPLGCRSGPRTAPSTPARWPSVGTCSWPGG